MDRYDDQDDQTVELGVASVETRGNTGSIGESNGHYRALGLTDD